MIEILRIRTIKFNSYKNNFRIKNINWTTKLKININNQNNNKNNF